MDLDQQETDEQRLKRILGTTIPPSDNPIDDFVSAGMEAADLARELKKGPSPERKAEIHARAKELGPTLEGDPDADRLARILGTKIKVPPASNVPDVSTTLGLGVNAVYDALQRKSLDVQAPTAPVRAQTIQGQGTGRASGAGPLGQPKTTTDTSVMSDAVRTPVPAVKLGIPAMQKPVTGDGPSRGSGPVASGDTVAQVPEDAATPPVHPIKWLAKGLVEEFGLDKLWRGLSNLANPDPRAHSLSDLSDIAEGAFSLGAPAMAIGGVAKPMMTAAMLAAGIVGQAAGENVADYFGATPETARFFGNMGALLGGFAGERVNARFGPTGVPSAREIHADALDKALETLGVDRDASADEIKAAYRKASYEAHPDRGGSDAAQADLNLAYQWLKENHSAPAKSMTADAWAKDQVEWFAKQAKDAVAEPEASPSTPRQIEAPKTALQAALERVTPDVPKPTLATPPVAEPVAEAPPVETPPPAATEIAPTAAPVAAPELHPMRTLDEQTFADSGQDVKDHPLAARIESKVPLVHELEPIVARELRKIREEMRTFRFENADVLSGDDLDANSSKEGFKDSSKERMSYRSQPGNDNLKKNEAGAPVYHDILAHGGYGTRGEVIDMIEKYLDGGRVTKSAAAAVKVARRMAWGTPEGMAVRPLGKAVKALSLPESGWDKPDEVYIDRPRLRAGKPDHPIEERTARAVEKNPKKFIKLYEKANGNVISTDDAAELFPSYAGSNDLRRQNVYAVRPSAHAIVNAVWDKAIEAAHARSEQGLDPVPEGKLPMVTALGGGTGSGKSTLLRHDPDIKNESYVVLDSTFSNSDYDDKRIEEAKRAGLAFALRFVYRDPVEAWTDGVLPRAMATGRPVSIKTHARTHIEALRNALDLEARHDPEVYVRGYRNFGGSVTEVPIEWLREQVARYNDQHGLETQLRDATVRAYKTGQIDAPTFRSLTGEDPPVARRDDGAVGQDSPRARLDEVLDHGKVVDALRARVTPKPEPLAQKNPKGWESVEGAPVETADEKKTRLIEASKNIEPREPQQWSREALQESFGLTPEQAEATDILAREMFTQAELDQRIKIGTLRKGQGALFQEDYRGLHRAPTRKDGAPGFDVAKGIYPDDVYSPKAAQYYGDKSDAYSDYEAAAIIQSMRGRPNAQVKIYRAVPNSVEKQIAKLEKRQRQILRRGSSDKWEYDTNAREIEQLKSRPAVDASQINPGDWVTTVRAYAKAHGESNMLGSYTILSKTVRAKDIFTDGNSMFEWGYDPENAAPAVAESRPWSSTSRLLQRAFHGSPHDFDRFSVKHIGTGEGAQAYGHGLYFAENIKVAEDYQKRLPDASSPYRFTLKDGTKLEEGTPERHAASLLYFGQKGEVRRTTRRWLKEFDGDLGMEDTAKQVGLTPSEYWTRLNKFAETHTRRDVKASQGSMYEVDIDDAAIEKMLDWDAPLKEQTPQIQQLVADKLRKARYLREGENGPRQVKAAWDSFRSDMGGFHSGDNGGSIYDDLFNGHTDAVAASEALNKAGVPGIRYYDEGSRDKKRGTRTRNMVVFDDGIVTVTRKNGQVVPKAEARDILTQRANDPTGIQGVVEFTQDGKAIISGVSDPNASTGVHELAHVARRFLLKEAWVTGEDGEWSGHAAGITADDVATAQEWAGAKNGYWDTKAEEKFARGFEAYLGSGEAPSPKLKSIFERFAQWLKDIYGKLFNSPIKIDISPEMMKVYDRLVTRVDRIRAEKAEASTVEDTLSTGEHQPRLPGDVGKVRDAEVTQPKLTDVAPTGQMWLRAGKTMIPVSSFEDAGHKFDTVARSASEDGPGSSQSSKVEVVNAAGDVLAHISPNGRIWQGKEPASIEEWTKNRPQEIERNDGRGYGKPSSIDVTDEALRAVEPPSVKLEPKSDKKWWDKPLRDVDMFDEHEKGDRLFQEKPTKVAERQQLLDDTFKEEPDEKAPSGNINLDKFPLPEPLKAELARVIEDNNGYIAQRRGVRSWAETRAVAEAISPYKSVAKAGTAFNAEQLEALAGQIVATREQLGDLSKKVEDGTADIKDRAQYAAMLTQEQVLLETYAGGVAEAGRALNILRKMRAAIQTNDMKLMEEGIKHAGGKEHIERVAKILNSFDKDDAIGKYRFIRSLQKPGVADWLTWYWYTNILSGPLTHMRNLTGNAAMSAFGLASQPFAGAVDLARSKVTGTPRTTYTSEVPQQIAGLARGAAEGWRKGAFLIKHGFTMDDVANSEFKPPEVAGGLATNFIGRSLEAADTLFRSMAYMQELHGHAYAAAKNAGLTPGSDEGHAFVENFLTNPPVRAVKEASRESARMIFRQKPGPLVNAIVATRKDIPVTLPSGRTLKLWNPLRLFIPFVQTPANIMKMSLESTPLGAFTAPLKDSPRERSKAGGRAALGTLLLAPLVWLAVNGQVSGSGPDDKELKDALYRTGWQPNSIKIGSKWYSYSNLQPLALPLSIVANMVEAYQMTGKAPTLGTVIGKTANSVLQQSYLSGLSALQDMLQSPERRGQAFIEKLAASAMPLSSAQGQVARALDPVIRQPDSIGEAIQANTPGFSEGVRGRMDAFGHIATRDSGLSPGTDILAKLFSPVTISQVKDSPLEDELFRLRGELQIGFPSKSITIDKQTIPLSPDEYDRLQQITGPAIARQLTRRVNSAEWMGQTDAEKVDDLHKVINEVRKLGRERILMDVVGRVKAERRAKREGGQ